MRRSRKIALIMTIMLVLIPGWLYASGNLPPLFAGEERLIRAVHRSCPRLSGATFKAFRPALEGLRNCGATLPCTYNERLLKIKALQDKVIKICDSIIMDG